MREAPPQLRRAEPPSRRSTPTSSLSSRNRTQATRAQSLNLPEYDPLIANLLALRQKLDDEAPARCGALLVVGDTPLTGCGSAAQPPG